MKVIRWILFLLYCFFILWTTLFSRTPNEKHIMELGLFWSYRLLLSGAPNGGKEVIQNIQNILFFIPFGVFFPNNKWKNVLIAAFSLSLSVEVLQYIYCLGWAEIDDVICNTLGAMIGFLTLALGRRIIIKCKKEKRTYRDK